MQRPEFRALERALVAADVAPKFVLRTIQELSDHFDDLADDARSRGLDREQARAFARAAIGSDASIVAAVSAVPALKCWYCRWPRSAAILRQIAGYGAMPVVPVVYCVHHGGSIARWSASAGLGALVTGALLFAMQMALP